MRAYKNYLITGGAGFIGANFIHYFFKHQEKTGGNANLINLDMLTYAGNLNHLSPFEDNPRYFFEKKDITHYDDMKTIFETYEIDCIIHFAAESHVDRSIDTPRQFLDTNIIGTYTLLEVAKSYWKNTLSDKLFYHVSTDEVYGSLGDTGLFYESTPYDPQSPYAASKASADHFVRAYANTYHLPTIISNCSNNYGPMQHDEKLIPVVINNILTGRAIPVYGAGLNVRDWLFVENHCEAIYRLVHQAPINQTYNIGGNNEIKNIDLVHSICEKIALKQGKNKDAYKHLINFVEDRKGHDFRYAINCDKINNEIGWTPRTEFEQGIDTTIDWYMEKC